MIEVTQLDCPDSGGKDGRTGEDYYTTHHLVPRSGSMTCRYCGRTEKQIRDSFSWFINEEGNVYDYDRTTQSFLFPNDDHTAYPTRLAAEAAAEAARSE